MSIIVNYTDQKYRCNKASI